MIDFNKENNILFRVGDKVSVNSLNDRTGSIDSIRLISEGHLVDEYQGQPERVVLTVNLGDAVVNKRGVEITSFT